MILCPRCRKSLDPDHRCPGLTRRFFFGLLAGASAAAFAPTLTDETWKWWRADDILGPYDRVWVPEGFRVAFTTTDKYMGGSTADERGLNPNIAQESGVLLPKLGVCREQMIGLFGGTIPCRLRARRVGEHRVVEALLV